MITFRLEPLADPRSIEARWCALESAVQPSFFLTWRWMSSWLATTEVRPHLLAARAGEADIGLAFVDGGPATDGSIAWNATGDPARDVGYIEYNGFLSGEPPERLAASAIEFLLRARDEGPLRGWKALRFGGVPRLWLERCRAAGLFVRVLSEQTTFAVDLDSLRAEGRDFHASLSANTRRQLLRARRLYEEIGPLRLEASEPGADSEAALRELIEFHQARWRGRGEPGSFASPLFERFVRHLATIECGTGAVEILRVKAGDRLIGVLVNLIAGRQVLNYLGGFVAEPDNRLKPGLVSHLLAIERHLAGGAAAYDLLAGGARYKASLASPRESLVWFVAKPRTLVTLVDEIGEFGRRAARRAVKVLRGRAAT